MYIEWRIECPLSELHRTLSEEVINRFLKVCLRILQQILHGEFCSGVAKGGHVPI